MDYTKNKEVEMVCFNIQGTFQAQRNRTIELWNGLLK